MPIAVLNGTPETPPASLVLASFSTTRIANPPMISAQATTTAFSSSMSIWSPNARPSTTAGKNAINRLRVKATADGSHVIRPLSTCMNVRQYKTTIARIAPGWMAMLNTAQACASKPGNSVARMRCPVEETGRNSVRPSTIPSRTGIRYRSIFRL